jgi:porin
MNFLKAAWKSLFRARSALVLMATPFPEIAAESRVSAGLDLTFEAAFGLKGGVDTGETAHGIVLAHASWHGPADRDEAVAWSGYASALGVAGHGPTGRFIGDFLGASNIEAHRSARLYTWWLEAARGDWSLRAGALLADEEFAGTDVGSFLINSAFGWPAFISANTINTGPAYFVAAPGVRIERTWGDSAEWRLGVYDGDSFDSHEGDPRPSRHGLHYDLGGDQGWFIISEVAVETPGGRTRFKAGAWLHTANFPDVRADDSGRPFSITGRNPLEHGSNSGAYTSIERELRSDHATRGSVKAFIRAGFAQRDRSPVSHAFDAGIACEGPIPGRPADIVTGSRGRSADGG